jgi:hypothetical protein
MKKLIKKNHSNLFTINWYDFGKAVIMFFIATFGDLIWQYCDAWLTDHTVVFNLKLTLRTSIVTTVGYFAKQFFSTNKMPMEPMQPDLTKKPKA